jgi:hypothetical protein
VNVTSSSFSSSRALVPAKGHLPSQRHLRAEPIAIQRTGFLLQQTVGSSLQRAVEPPAEVTLILARRDAQPDALIALYEHVQGNTVTRRQGTYLDVFA